MIFVSIPARKLCMDAPLEGVFLMLFVYGIDISDMVK